MASIVTAGNSSSAVPLWNTSARSVTGSGECDPQCVEEKLWATRTDLMWITAGPIMAVLGIVGNVMAIIALHRMLSEESVFPRLLLALAVQDLLLLVVMLLTDVLHRALVFPLQESSAAFCKLFWWMVLSVRLLSSWLLAALTINCALLLLFPVWAHSLKPRKQAVLTILLLASTSLIANSVALYFSDINNPEGQCRWNLGAKVRLVFWLLLAMNAIVPSVLMLACNFPMIRAMVRLKHLSSKTKTAVCPSSSRSWSDNQNQNQSIQIQKNLKENLTHSAPSRPPLDRVEGGMGLYGSATQRDKLFQLTLTLIVTSLAFMLLTLPLYVLYLLEYGNYMYQYQTTSFKFYTNLADLLRYANSAVKFYIYLLTGFM